MDKKLRHDRILDCRYYNGEEECPEGINQMFWGYEKGWSNGHHEKEWLTEKEDMKRLGIEYFEPKDGTPYELKCLLFNRYCHWIGLYDGAEAFLRWYKEEYQNPRLTNRQRRALYRVPNLIKRCLFYKGEEDCPFEHPQYAHFWKYEKIWVEMMSQSYSNAEQWRYDLHRHPKIEQYVKERGLPSSLIGLLINRDEHWGGMIVEDDYIAALKKLYLKEN